MNIQSYILPEWKKMIRAQELAKPVELQFNTIGESMAEYLDRYMMRTVPTNWYNGWTRYHFPLHTHGLVLDLHRVIATHFEEYIEKFREGRKSEFGIPNGQVNKIKLLEQRYKKYLQQEQEQIDEIRNDIKESRPKPVRKERPKRIEKIQNKAKPKETSSQGELREFNHDYVYKKWMEMVESKPISKSYWHIHEYMSRYILEFANKHTDDGIVTKQVIDDFLVDYGKGKRPKTMNHYNRVVHRFWEFYENLIKEEGNEMEVW